VAVLRPHAWIMLGHCAGLRASQQLGDYVLAHGYVREDHVLDEELPLWVPIPALAEIQQALQQAVEEVTHLQGQELKRIMRTGTVASTDNRNWELLPGNQPQRRFSQSRAVALDMESATIAANGFRFRVPYGTLLCVSDKPLHGEIKLPGMANHFYRERVNQHLQIGIRALELLRREYDWRDYGAKHSESRFTKFYQDIYLPRKFGFDKRRLHLSSLIVSGQLSRDQAMHELQQPILAPAQMCRDSRFVAKKLGMAPAELERLIDAPSVPHTDYPNQAALRSVLDRAKRLARRISLRRADRPSA
jgi:nucleoside phosphorylase